MRQLCLCCDFENLDDSCGDAMNQELSCYDQWILKGISNLCATHCMDYDSGYICIYSKVNLYLIYIRYCLLHFTFSFKTIILNPQNVIILLSKKNVNIKLHLLTIWTKTHVMHILL